MIVRTMRMGMKTDLVFRVERISDPGASTPPTRSENDKHAMWVKDTCRTASGYHHTNICIGGSSPCDHWLIPLATGLTPQESILVFLGAANELSH